MTKYRIMKNAYDKLVALKSKAAKSKDIHVARSEFRAAALELFPKAGSRAEASGRDLIEYYQERYSRKRN